MDTKSIYQDTELMLVIHSTEFNTQLKQYFNHYHQDADIADDHDDMNDLREKNILYVLLEWLDPLVRYLF